MITSKMSFAMYSTLYDINDLDKLVTRCRDIYARSNEASAESSTPATGGATAPTPFTSVKEENALFYMEM